MSFGYIQSFLCVHFAYLTGIAKKWRCIVSGLRMFLWILAYFIHYLLWYWFQKGKKFCWTKGHVFCVKMGEEFEVPVKHGKIVGFDHSLRDYPAINSITLDAKLSAQWKKTLWYFSSWRYPSSDGFSCAKKGNKWFFCLQNELDVRQILDDYIYHWKWEEEESRGKRQNSSQV